MAYGQFGLFECMCCHKIATEDPGVFCPDCTETMHSLLTALDASTHDEAVCVDPDNGWEILVKYHDDIDEDDTNEWLVAQGIEDQPPVQYDTYANLMQVAAAFPHTRWSPVMTEEEV